MPLTLFVMLARRTECPFLVTQLDNRSTNCHYIRYQFQLLAFIDTFHRRLESVNNDGRYTWWPAHLQSEVAENIRKLPIYRYREPRTHEYGRYTATVRWEHTNMADIPLPWDENTRIWPIYRYHEPRTHEYGRYTATVNREHTNMTDIPLPWDENTRIWPIYRYHVPRTHEYGRYTATMSRERTNMVDIPLKCPENTLICPIYRYRENCGVRHNETKWRQRHRTITAADLRDWARHGSVCRGGGIAPHILKMAPGWTWMFGFGHPMYPVLGPRTGLETVKNR
jgi:hypothetical protein